MIPSAFEYESPGSLAEALELLATREDAKLLAGGHSLLPAMKLRLAQPTTLIDLGRIAGLDVIRESGDHVSIGALATHAAVAGSSVLQKASPLLLQTARHIGDTQVRNRGTLGGSLAQAHPSADYPASVLALDAEIVARSRKGERVIAARDFFTGMFTTALAADEIITEVRVPKTAGAKTVYRKFEHPASGYAVVGVAVVLRQAGGKIESVAVGVTGVGPQAYRASTVESALRGKSAGAIAEAASTAADGVEPMGDTFASSQYRKHMAVVLTRRALEEAAGTR